MRRFAAAAAVFVLAGCVTLPENGPVKNRPDPDGTSQAGSFDYNPEGPQPGDPPATIVSGFVDAQRQSPLTFSAARGFLTDEASATWKPNRRTIVYDDGSIETVVDGDQATVTLGATVELDSRGTWLGDTTDARGVRFRLRLARQGDSWRITNPPDALIIPRSHFDTRFVRYYLHFFDPSGTVLVPEPVYVPAGPDVPSLLVSGLLAGPDQGLRSVERTFFPAQTTLELSVPVERGVADVPLSGELLETDPEQLDLAMAQLAWTLRQVPGIQRMRVTVDGTPIDNRTGASVRSLQGWTGYDPAVPGARRDLFGIRDGEIVAAGEEQTVVSAAYRRTAVRSIGVSLGGSTDQLSVAAVTAGGRRVLTSVLPPVAGSGERARLRYVGTDVLRPAYDLFGTLWLVDRTSTGAAVVTLARGGAARVLRVRGLTGQDVTSFSLSRDGTRLAALVDGRVVVARVSRSETGRPTRVLRGYVLPLPEEARPVDLAWTNPGTLGILDRIAPAIAQVSFASVDGSHALDGDLTPLEPLFKRAHRLIAAPVVDNPILLRARSGQLYRESPAGPWTPVPSLSDLRAPTFPG